MVNVPQLVHLLPIKILQLPPVLLAFLDAYNAQVAPVVQFVLLHSSSFQVIYAFAIMINFN